MAEVPLSERVANFKRGFGEQQSQHPTDHLTPEQERELARDGSELLKHLLASSSRFQLGEELDQKARELRSTHMTPAVPIMGDSSAEGVISIVSGSTREVDLLPPPGYDQLIGETSSVWAMLVLHVPESSNPIPLIQLEGEQTAQGDLQLTGIGTTDQFFGTQDDPSRLTRQMTAIAQAHRITRVIDVHLRSVPSGILSVNGRPGHGLVVTDARGNTQEQFIPHTTQ